MDQFADYSLEELLLSADFRQKVTFASPKELSEFNGWLQDNPDKQHKFRVAIETIRAVQPNKISLPAEQQKVAVESILNLTSRRTPRRSYPAYQLSMMAVAAASILLVSLYWFNYLPFGQKNNKEVAVLKSPAEITWIHNKTATPELISLSDGSIVILKPGSSLRYPAVFEPGQRKVELKGEAFFEISKDTLRPFYVYANESVTRVLGTSFNVRAFQNESKIIVKVQTGKVSVSNLPAPGSPDEKSILTIIEPDQKVSIDRVDRQIEKSGIQPGEQALPTLISDTGNREIPVSEIFQDLQNAYGVTIDYDQESMAGYEIMANMEHLHLLEKIDAICLAVNAAYRVERGHIIISSNNSRKL